MSGLHAPAHPIAHFALLVCLFWMLGLPATQAAEPAIPWPTRAWPTSTPEAQGMASAALAEMVDAGAAGGMDSLLVVRHGHIVAEAHYAPFQPQHRHLVNSVTKSVMGTLTGIALQQGVLERLDQPVFEFFPERPAASLDAAKKAITLQHLLDMSSGMAWVEPLSNAVPVSLLEMARSPDWVSFVLDRPMVQAPGAGFNYNSGSWQLLSALLARKTGGDTFEFANRQLFAPLGITDVVWRRDPQGLPTGGAGLFLAPRDMAKLGYLTLHQGRWEGRQLLPPAWTTRIFDAQVDMKLDPPGLFRYANGWWTIPSKRAAIAVGFLGQMIIVLPEADMVAVVTARRLQPLPRWIDRLTAAVKSPQALPADADGAARLAERIRHAGTEQPSPVGPVSPLAAAISGKVYRLEPNALRINSLMLDLSATEPRYDMVSEGGTRSPAAGAVPPRIAGPLGLDGRFRLRDAGPADALLAAKGHWLNDSSFQVIARSVLEGNEASYTLNFSGKAVEVAVQLNNGVRARLRGETAD